MDSTCDVIRLLNSLSFLPSQRCLPPCLVLSLSVGQQSLILQLTAQRLLIGAGLRSLIPIGVASIKPLVSLGIEVSVLLMHEDRIQYNSCCNLLVNALQLWAEFNI